MSRSKSIASSTAALELRVALRRLAKRPLATLAVLLSLALSLALASLVLSVADRLLVRPLPWIADFEDLVVLQRVAPEGKHGDGSLSWLDLETIRRQAETSQRGSFPAAGVSGHYATFLGLADANAASAGTRRIEAVVHSDGYGDTLGISPRLGRWPKDEPGGAAEAAIGHRLWLDLGGDPKILGRTIRLQGHGVEVVGVLPEGFVGTDHVHRPQVWIPIATFERLATGIDGQWVAKRDAKTWLTVMARMRGGGWTQEGALTRLHDLLADERPDVWQDYGLAGVPLLHRAFGGSELREAIERHLALLALTLLGALGVAYGNAAVLVTTRAVDRRAGWSLRAALGAERRQLAAASSLEGLLLAVTSMAVAPFFVFLLTPLIRHLQLPGDALIDVTVGARQLAPCLVLGTLGVVLLTLAPGLAAAVARGTRFTAPYSRAAMSFGAAASSKATASRQLFVAAQVALTFVALGAAFQLVRTVHAYRQVDAGISTEASSNVLAVGLDVGAAGHDGADALDAFRQIDHTLRAVSGVESASLAATLPLLRSGPMVNLTLQAEGADPPPDGGPHTALHALVGSGFFSTVGRQTLEGRDFEPGDDEASAPVVIVNRTLADRLWGDRSALGRQVRLVAAEDPYTVVGVVADGRYAGLSGPAEPTLYMAHAQSARSLVATSLATSATVLVRLRGPAGRGASKRLTGDIRAAVAQVDPAVPVVSIQPLRELIEGHFAVERQVSAILVAVAGALLLFSLLGVYGGLTHSFVRQRRPLAVRAALGAGRRHLLAGLAADTGRSLALGLLAGAWLVPPTSALLRGLLFGVSMDSSGSWLAAVAILLTAVALAGLDPARQALSLEVTTLLREE